MFRNFLIYVQKACCSFLIVSASFIPKFIFLLAILNKGDESNKLALLCLVISLGVYCLI